jgi:hypothetical protein
MIANNDFNRSLSRIFTNPVFKQIAQSGNSDYFLSKLKGVMEKWWLVVDSMESL